MFDTFSMISLYVLCKVQIRLEICTDAIMPKFVFSFRLAMLTFIFAILNVFVNKVLEY